MFESLQDGLKGALKSLRGKGKLTEANMREGLRMVEQSLLEADVSYSVVQDFMQRVTEQAIGEKVLLSLDPSQQLVGVVHQELINILGPVDASLHLKQDGVTILMLCGLQGSGKTTTCAKLARLIQKQGHRVMMVAADLQRPAAIEQLHVLGEQVGVDVYSELGAQDPVKVCRDAVKKATDDGMDVVILDTAGRLAIDEELMAQLARIDNRVQPDQVYLVVDGMTGQDAVNSAAAFNESLELDGVIMTKLDGDARGGAMLSVKHVTGVPIKFIGTGEQIHGIEPFQPDGMAGRILGMGDILGLVHTAQTEFDQKEMEKAQQRMQKGEFTLDDFRKQLTQIAQPGLMQRMMSLMPGMGEINKMLGADSDMAGGMKRMFGIIDSMTPDERRDPKVIEPRRRLRIARGAGVQSNEVNDLIKQFNEMAGMMKSLAGKGAREQMAAIKDMQKQAMGGGGFRKQKVGTGKRLTAKDRAKKKQMRSKAKGRRRRK